MAADRLDPAFPRPPDPASPRSPDPTARRSPDPTARRSPDPTSPRPPASPRPSDPGPGRISETYERFSVHLQVDDDSLSRAGRPSEIYERFSVHPQLEARISALGASQHLVFHIDQLAAIGLAARTVQQRAKVGRLHRIYQSVYSLVPESALTARGRWMAAVLACGPDAALSHRSAGTLEGLWAKSGGRIDVTIPRRAPRKHAGVALHRSTTLMPADVTVVDGIPCTTVARTLFDLAEELTQRQLERAFDQADILEVLDLNEIDDQLSRNRTRRGAPKVRRLLNEHYIGSTVTDSYAEEFLIPLLRAAGVRMPRTQFWIVLEDGEPPLRRDFVWPDLKLDVEIDGKTHRTAQALERDARNDLRLADADWRVIRIPWKRLEADPDRVVPTIARAVTRATELLAR
jgi:hypothetical protein